VKTSITESLRLRRRRVHATRTTKVSPARSRRSFLGTNLQMPVHDIQICSCGWLCTVPTQPSHLMLRKKQFVVVGEHAALQPPSGADSLLSLCATTMNQESLVGASIVFSIHSSSSNSGGSHFLRDPLTVSSTCQPAPVHNQDMSVHIVAADEHRISRHLRCSPGSPHRAAGILSKICRLRTGSFRNAVVLSVAIYPVQWR